MKAPLYFIFTLILNIISTVELKIEDHVNLITDIYDFYKQSSVMLIHFIDKKSMADMKVVFETILMFSRKNIKAVTINFEEIAVFKTYYDSRLKMEKHPMSVILLTSTRAAQKFEEISNFRILDKSVNLVIFQEIVKNPLKGLCLRTVGNSFKLKIDTLLLVKCYEENVIRQLYSIYGNETKLYDWASWDSKTGLLLKANDTFHTRRAGLYGKVLRIATVESSSISCWKNGLLVGYLGDLIRILEKSLNFTANFVREVTDYGCLEEISGHWSGAMGLAVRKEVDLVAADFEMTSQRSESIDFSTPLFFSRTVLYIRKPSTKLALNWYAHFKPFKKESWSILILFILIMSILLTCIEKHDEESKDKLSRFSKNYFIVWRIYCQQGMAETPTVSSFRIVYFSFLCSAFVIASVYSASLVSTFAIPTISMPFTSLEGFVKDGSYQLAIIRDSAYSDFFDHANDSTLRDMKKMIMGKEDQPITLQEAFDMVCNKRVAFYISETAGEIDSLNITCQLIKINTGRYNSVAMVLQKDSEYTQLINYQLTKLKGNGVLDHLHSENFARIKESFVSEEFNRVDLPGVIILLAITTGGAILGLIIFFGERIYFHYMHRGKKKSKTTKHERILTRDSGTRSDNARRRRGRMRKIRRLKSKGIISREFALQLRTEAEIAASQWTSVAPRFNQQNVPMTNHIAPLSPRSEAQRDRVYRSPQFTEWERIYDKFTFISEKEQEDLVRHSYLGEARLFSEKTSGQEDTIDVQSSSNVKPALESLTPHIIITDIIKEIDDLLADYM